jgi:hypothetical protein
MKDFTYQIYFYFHINKTEDKLFDYIYNLFDIDVPIQLNNEIYTKTNIHFNFHVK